MLNLRRTSLILLTWAVLFTACSVQVVFGQGNTFCNPINIDYRFSLEGPVRREAADPEIVLYKDDYYLFASKSGGYWYSKNLGDWTFVQPEGLPLEDYAPAILILEGRMYLTASKTKAIYTTDNPKSGKWSKVADTAGYPDPAFLLDDGHVYLYFGAALNGSISVVELDPKDNFKVIAGPFKLLSGNFADHGWERSGEENLGAPRNGVFRADPYIEGSFMTKHNGTYYLQYSAPGTIWKTYADGVYTSKSPIEGFTYAPYSPFSYKPGGFIGSAGHAATFQDKSGRYWRVVTMVVSVAHKFERRLGIFPVDFDKDGVMHTNTYLGDYPQFLPGVSASPIENNRPGWMLLSYSKASSSSSTDDSHPTANAFDEDVRTYWSAKTGHKGEWLSVDLGTSRVIRAVQINFAEHEMKAYGRAERLYQQYVIEVSNDGKRWSPAVDKSGNTRDVPHDYVELARPVRARYVRITNIHTPAQGNFAIRDLRVFGQGTGKVPAQVSQLTAERNEKDQRTVKLEWRPVPGVNRYIVRFGVAPGKLYNSYEIVDGKTTLTINSLNTSVKYYFTVDAVNEAGRSEGKIVKSA